MGGEIAQSLSPILVVVFGRVRRLFTASVLIVLTGNVSAATATTTPRGIYTVKVPGTEGGQPQARTYLGLQLLPPITFSGIPQSVTDDRVNFGVDHRQIVNSQGVNYLHVVTGNGMGFLSDITEFSQVNLRCARDLIAWIPPGSRVVIRSHPSLNDVFGATNRFGLTAGESASGSDNVVIWDPVLQKERVYYFHSSRSRWEEAGVEADASDALLRFPYGFYLIRRSPGTLRISLSGDVASYPVLLPVRTGDNVFSLPVNLSGSLAGLFSSTSVHSVKGGTNSDEADILVFEESVAGNQKGPFYFSTRAGDEGWRAAGHEGAVPAVDFLSTLVLRRKGADGYIRAEASLVPNPNAPTLPADPEAGENPLTGELQIPPNLPGSLSLQVEVSKDLQTWNHYVVPTLASNKATFQLPAGQTRGFYRLKITSN